MNRSDPNNTGKRARSRLEAPRRTPESFLGEPVTTERLERAVALLAWLVINDSEVYAPLFRKLKTELKLRESIKEEAAAFLQERQGQSAYPVRLLGYDSKNS
ncbi:hypothetical protein [Flexibacterium corallicola]|uniref:hypothetical protein n=1 Tax=Flexibacterium corallicola TaxID=3037259 RepID=UPI00286ED9AA|nr:hypothetical protein [Pseudovibrio sp. M1P-2-3]